MVRLSVETHGRRHQRSILSLVLALVLIFATGIADLIAMQYFQGHAPNRPDSEHRYHIAMGERHLYLTRPQHHLFMLCTLGSVFLACGLQMLCIYWIYSDDLHARN